MEVFSCERLALGSTAGPSSRVSPTEEYRRRSATFNCLIRKPDRAPVCMSFTSRSQLSRAYRRDHFIKKIRTAELKYVDKGRRLITTGRLSPFSPAFDSSKLSIVHLDQSGYTGPAPSPALPRRYTLTHNDLTGELFLSIGRDFNTKQLEGWYTMLLRDEVLAEWHEDGLHIHCFVSALNQWWLAPAALRNSIFVKEIPLVLDTLRYAERKYLQQHQNLATAPTRIHYHALEPGINRIESWGPLIDASSCTSTVELTSSTPPHQLPALVDPFPSFARVCTSLLQSIFTPMHSPPQDSPMKASQTSSKQPSLSSTTEDDITTSRYEQMVEILDQDKEGADGPTAASDAFDYGQEVTKSTTSVLAEEPLSDAPVAAGTPAKDLISDLSLSFGVSNGRGLYQRLRDEKEKELKRTPGQRLGVNAAQQNGTRGGGTEVSKVKGKSKMW